MNQFNCPHCGQILQDDGSLAGQTVACPACGQMFRMPGGPQPYVAPAPAVQPAPPAAAGPAGWAPPAGPPAQSSAQAVPGPPPDDGPDMSLPFEVAPVSEVASRVTEAAGETQGSKVMLWTVIGGLGFVVALVAVIFIFGLLGGSSDDGGGGSAWSDVIARLKDEDPGTRREAADAILRSGPATVTHALTSITEVEGDQLGMSENGCSALASLGSEIVGPLTSALHSDSPAARAGAARVLREMGSTAKGAAADLGNCLDDNQRAVRLAAADVLINLGADAAPAVDRLAAALTNGDQEVRRRAIKILVKIGPGAKSAIPALLLAGRTDPPDWETQQAAQKALQLLDPQNASGHLLDNASDEIKELWQTMAVTGNPAEDRVAALKGLASKGHEAAFTVPAIYKVLRHETDKSVRVAAAEALGHFGSEAYYVAPGLDAIAAAADGEVAAAARAAMESIRPRK